MKNGMTTMKNSMAAPLKIIDLFYGPAIELVEL